MPDSGSDAGFSAAPVRAAGTRARGGNAMGRTRVAALDGALRCVESYGTRRTTMGDIATRGGIAKGTLYNHFRTKDDVFTALVEREVSVLAEEAATLAVEQGPAAALTHAAQRVSTHAALRRMAVDEQAVLARLALSRSGAGWQRATEGVARVLAAATDADRGGDGDAVEIVLRWLAAHLVWPSADPSGQAALLGTALPVDRPPVDRPPVDRPPVDTVDSPSAPEAQTAGHRHEAGGLQGVAHG